MADCRSRSRANGAPCVPYENTGSHDPASETTKEPPVTTVELLTDFDLHLLAEGLHERTWEQLGAHLKVVDGVSGVRFAVWAPNASRVAVIGDFNDWNPDCHPMLRREAAGIWECFVPHIGAGALYKYRIEARHGDYRVDKADPYGFAAELRPRTASKVWDLDRYVWRDGEWMSARARRSPHGAPMSIYEVHLGSWRRVPEEGDRWLTYRELAPALADYVHDMGYTHVELLPVTEHPFDGSWGYQTIGYFAPTSRFGTPDDFMYLVDTLHRRGIGVILDWVPAHFPRDAHGLGYFDGTHLYEHADPRQGLHPEWDTSIFNYGRLEVRNFLIGNALFWIERYHVDALRVDAVTSMLRLDYGRGEGAWIPNRFGGPENLEAVDFVRRLNDRVETEHPGVTVIAEESTAWPAVTRPTSLGGLGFGFKWNMGWMHDILEYLAEDPIYRGYAHNKITFSLFYAFSERFVLPLSHDEVVYGKGSLLSRMPGDDWQRFANLRLLYGYLFGHPGKKLLFMGGEFGQWREWNHDRSLDWHLLGEARHRGLQRWVRDLNTMYRGEPALYQVDHDAAGFEWVDCNDHEHSIVSFLRRAADDRQTVLVVVNFTPVPRHNYRVGVPVGGYWTEVLNSDAERYGGSGQGNLGGVDSVPLPMHGRPHALTITLPPLAVVMFRGPRHGATA
jgi:1,4-alpha-glucan branching enzyme